MRATWRRAGTSNENRRDEILVARDEDLQTVVSTALQWPPGAGDQGADLQTSWQPDDELDGDLFWSARAVDAMGSASEWAPPFTLAIEGPVSNPDGVGCGCDFTENGTEPVGLLGLVVLLGAAGLRRRR